LNNQLSSETIKTLLGLRPLRQEGGFYCQTYRSADSLPQAVLPPRYDGDRLLATAIYYLLTSDDFSALHRLKSDEIYHFYLGDAVTLLLLRPDGTSETLTLGQDMKAGHQLQVTVPRGVWQGAFVQTEGAFALLGTTMSPGYHPADFELGERQTLLRAYPNRDALIQRLTRA